VAKITPRALINPCIDEPRAHVVAIAARDRARAESYARHAHIRYVLDDYQAVIDHPRVNAIYNPLLITAHKEWTLKALAAGKPVLCEKSFASNVEEAQAMADAAAAAHLVVMDAFHYRYHPVFIRAKEIYDSGVLGTIEHVSAAFHIPITDANDIRMDYATGGGVTMDIGCYPISWVRHITGEEPVDVTAQSEVGPPHVDLLLEAQMTFPSGVQATTSGDMRPEVQFRADIDVVGSAGTLKVVNPIAPQIGHAIQLTVNGRTTTETLDRRPTYGYQLDAFIAAVEEGAPIFTGPEDAVAQMRLIDRCYEAAGLPVRGLVDP
jgi:predicted dehydrogenase